MGALFQIVAYSIGNLFLGILLTVVGVILLFVLIQSWYRNSTFTPVSYIVGGILFLFLSFRKHSVNHVFLSPTSIINFTSKKQSYDDTRRSSRDNELLQRAQSDL